MAFESAALLEAIREYIALTGQEGEPDRNKVGDLEWRVESAIVGIVSENNKRNSRMGRG